MGAWDIVLFKLYCCNFEAKNVHFQHFWTCSFLTAEIPLTGKKFGIHPAKLPLSPEKPLPPAMHPHHSGALSAVPLLVPSSVSCPRSALSPAAALHPRAVTCLTHLNCHLHLPPCSLCPSHRAAQVLTKGMETSCTPSHVPSLSSQPRFWPD